MDRMLSLSTVRMIPTLVLTGSEEIHITAYKCPDYSDTLPVSLLCSTKVACRNEYVNP